MTPAFGARPTPGDGLQLSLGKRFHFHCTSSWFTNAAERRRLRDVWLARLAPPALYQVPVRSLSALTRMRPTTNWNCRLDGAFAGFLPTVGHPPAVALVSYFVDRSHSRYTAFLKTFVLVQGTFTPQVEPHARRPKKMNRSGKGRAGSLRSFTSTPRPVILNVIWLG